MMIAMSSTESRSSRFEVKFHLIHVLFPAVVFLIIIKKLNPDFTSPCLTPVLTLNHSDSSPSYSIVLHDFP